MYSQLSMDARWKVSHSSSKQMFRWKINLIGATTHHPPLSFTSEKDFFFFGFGFYLIKKQFVPPPLLHFSNFSSGFHPINHLLD